MAEVNRPRPIRPNKHTPFSEVAELKSELSSVEHLINNLLHLQMMLNSWLSYLELEATQTSPVLGEGTNTATAPGVPSYLPWSSVVRDAKRCSLPLFTPLDVHLANSFSPLAELPQDQDESAFLTCKANHVKKLTSSPSTEHFFDQLSQSFASPQCKWHRRLQQLEAILSFHLQITATEPLFPSLGKSSCMHLGPAAY
ncbi:hypothetical protein ILYODFUR_023322 [Ilyodon furcidens]|uniref:Uncharacterized protein n=1 Tax=Ilyodon furcidens TaxID=33524 RepID=A0ABV0UUV0_9TELE